MRSWLALTLFIVSLFVSPALAAERRVALIIGNGAYTGTGSLVNTVNDARAIAARLEALDFDVTLATDIDRKTAIETIDKFSTGLNGADIAFLFYAGHGMQIGGENFLLPVDVDVSSERALRYSAIDIGEVVREMERRARVALVVLDACRDNPFLDVLQREAQDNRAVVPLQGLSIMRLSGRGAIIAYAAAAGEVAADGAGQNSPYTAALIEEIEKPGVEVGLMFRRVAGRVFEGTGGAQRPELLVRLVDEVYLKPTEENLVAAAEAAETMLRTRAGHEAELKLAAANLALARSTKAEGFFGQRVLHKPAWADGVSLPPAPAWTPAAPQRVAEAAVNDGFGTAQPIPLAAEIDARIAPRGDTDWFRFEVPIAGELRLTVPSAPAALDLVARVWNSDKIVIADWQGSGRPGGALDVRFPIPGPGIYSIELADSYSDADSSEAFALTADFAPANDPMEANNTVGSAQPIPVPSTFRPAIWPKGDSDWYRVWVPEPGLLTLAISDVPETLDIAVRLWNLDGTVVKDWQGPPRPGGDTLLQAELSEPGIYAVEMADSYSDQADTRTFSFSAEFAPVVDEAEPNNAFGLAAQRSGTNAQRIAIFPRGDTDWLSVDIDHPGELRVAASRIPQNLDVSIRVWNANKDVLKDWTGPLRIGGDVDLFADLPEPGRYFVEIADGYSDQASPDLFNLAMNFTPQPDQYEPNNGMASATPMAASGEVLFNILPRGDTDWFRVEVPAQGELKVLIDEGPDNLDLHYRVWTADRALVRDWVAPYRKGGLTEGFADLPRGGSYFIEVADGSGDDRSIKHAVLRTAYTPALDPLEPNDTYGSAQPFPLGQAHKAWILPKGDVDWYTLEAPREGEFDVAITDVDPLLDIAFRVWNPAGEPTGWVSPARAGGDTVARVAVKGAGQYRLEVADSYSDERSQNPYTIRVDFR